MWLVKVFPESKVTPRFLTILVPEIEFPKKLVGKFFDEGLSVKNDN